MPNKRKGPLSVGPTGKLGKAAISLSNAQGGPPFIPPASKRLAGHLAMDSGEGLMDEVGYLPTDLPTPLLDSPSMTRSGQVTIAATV